MAQNVTITFSKDPETFELVINAQNNVSSFLTDGVLKAVTASSAYRDFVQTNARFAMSIKKIEISY